MVVLDFVRWWSSLRDSTLLGSLSYSRNILTSALMPELPEVETTRRGLAPHLEGRRIVAVTLRRQDLRWPIPKAVSELLPGQTISAIRRRAKYLLMDTAAGTAIWHLGMSGSMRVLAAETPVREHDHVDLLIESAGGAASLAPSPTRPANGARSLESEQSMSTRVLRFNDPRRFGCLLWQAPGETHELLRGLGPEPLPDDADGAALDSIALDGVAFDGDYLYERSRGRSVPVKAFLMDQKIVVGVGNIYAAEALFAAGVSPLRAAGKVSRERYGLIATAVREILSYAIRRGGTTLRDFLSPDGAPGYFEQELSAYGRGGEPCPKCGRALKEAMLAQRTTVWCGHCQK
jgi:formamidopyrimidine-DNA glycosylase